MAGAPTADQTLLNILLNYSGLHAIVCHRVAHTLDRCHVPILPRLLMTIVRWITGTEIHPRATIGRGLFIDHGMGVVIGETAVIGLMRRFQEKADVLGSGHEESVI